MMSMKIKIYMIISTKQTDYNDGDDNDNENNCQK